MTCSFMWRCWYVGILLEPYLWAAATVDRKNHKKSPPKREKGLQRLKGNFRWDYAFQAPILSPGAAVGTWLRWQHSHCGAKQMKWIPGSGSECLTLCHEQPWEASEVWESPAITMWTPVKPWYSQMDPWASTSSAHSADLDPPWHSQACPFHLSGYFFHLFRISCTQSQSTLSNSLCLRLSHS